MTERQIKLNLNIKYSDALWFVKRFTAPVQDQAGRTPLQCAAYGGYITCMAVLMENNADPNIQDKEVKTDSYVHDEMRPHVFLRFLSFLCVHRGGLLSTGHVTTATWMLSSCCWATMPSRITWSTPRRGQRSESKRWG